MKGIFITIITAIVAFVIFTVVLVTLTSGGTTSLLTAGDYVYGEDIAEQSYMFQLQGPGEVIIKTQDGEESYYRELKDGESVHEHYLPLEKGDTLTITDGATVQLI